MEMKRRNTSSRTPGFEIFDVRVDGHSLLICDGETPFAEALRSFAERRGFACRLTKSGEEALEAIRQEPPSVAVVAAESAGQELDGLRLLDLVRHDVRTASVPVIVTHHDSTREREALRLGAYDYMVKPLHPEKLAGFLAARVSGMKSEGARSRVLVVDDDLACRALAQAVLSKQGYLVETADSVAAALPKLDEHVPDLLILDVRMPGMDGVDGLKCIRSDPRMRAVPAIFATALGGISDKVRALKAGGDDYLVKPWDGRELVARVEVTLRKTREDRGMSPNTLLPGTDGITRELRRRGSLDREYGFCYVDVDNFKAFNDNYGYVRADAVIQQLADILRVAVEREGDGDDFLAHIAGDDFVLVSSQEACTRIIDSVLSEFDAIVPFHYDPVDREKRHIVAEDRYGTLRRFPLMSLSAVGLACTAGEKDYLRISDEAAAIKKRAKKVPQSVFLRDW